MRVDVLLVCTANRCRSPLAAALLRRELGDSAKHVQVRSAGLLPGGAPVPRDGIAAMRKLGLDLSEHHSIQLDRRMLIDADLVLAMAREHARECIALEPRVARRIFTLKEFVRRARTYPRSEAESLDQWILRLSQDRNIRDLVRPVASDDIDDPINRSRRTWRRVVTELGDLTAATALLLDSPFARSRN